MSAFIHGWRVFSFTNCSKTGLPCLSGASGMHLHNKVQKAAECRGISPAIWMTEAAKERSKLKSAGLPSGHDEPAPNYDCTCGNYFYRTFKDAWQSASNVYAHVTCLERTILHVNGGRTTQYSVDYLLPSTRGDVGQKVYLPIDDPAKAKGPVVNQPFSFYDFNMQMEERLYSEVLSEIALSLGVPILDEKSLLGCPVCLVVNGWREPGEISERMKREWFGLGYHG